jgi:hypothetical protein
MAIAAGDEVALKRVVGQATLGARGNVLFGIALTTDVNVVWENGALTNAIPNGDLDQIVGVGNPPATIVTFNDGGNTDNITNDYRCVVVRRYTRNPAGTGSPVSYTLMRSISTGQLYEVPTSAVVALNN